MSAVALEYPAEAYTLGWSLGLSVHTSAEAVEHVEEGFPVEALQRIARYLDLSEDELARLAGTSVRTLARRRKAGRLEPAESDRLYRVARLFERAVDVFGGDDLALEEARQWFHTPQWALGGVTPLAYAHTEPGAHEVGALLGRIDYGVLA